MGLPLDDSDLGKRLEELAARLSVIEERLGIKAEVRAVAPPVVEAPPMNAATAHVAGKVVDLDELARRRQAEREAEESAARARRVAALEEITHRSITGGTPVPPPAVPPPVAPPVAPPLAPPLVHGHGGLHVPTVVPITVETPVPHQTVPPRAKAEPFSFEKLIGGKLFAVVGAIMVVIAVGLLLKLAVDQHWFTVSPLMRCIGVAGFGFTLIGLGEWARRKINVMASLGVSAAGVAVVYAAAFASYGWYELVTPAVGFVLLAMASALGIGVALRAKSIAVAALALVAAYMTPIVIGDHGSSPLVMPIYLVALLALGLVLAAWRPDPFRMLRQFVWWGTVVVGTGWMLKTEWRHTSEILGFLGVVWCAVHAALWMGSKRLEESVALGWGPKSVQKRVTRPIVLSFASTAWTVTMGVLAVQFAATTFPMGSWAVPAVAAVGTLTLAMMLAGNLRVLRDAPETDAERLGASLWMQAGAMLIAAVALGVSDWAQVVAWLSMGLAAAAVGRWIKARSLDVYAIIVLSIAAVRLVVYESWHAGFGATGNQEVYGLVLGRWTVLMAAGGLAWIAASFLMNHPSAEASVPSRRRVVGVDLCIGIGLTLVYGGLISPDAKGVAMISAAGVLGIVVLVAARLRRSVLLDVWGGAALALATFASGMMQLSGAGKAVTTIGPVLVTDWGWTLAWLGAAWLIGSWVIRRAGGVAGLRRNAVDAFIGIGLSAMWLSVASNQSSATAITIGAGVLALGVLSVARVRGAVMLERWGILALACASAFGLYAQLGGWTHSSTSVGVVVFTNFSVVMVCLAGVWLAAMGLLRRADPSDPGDAMGRSVRNVCIAVALPMLYMSIASTEAASSVMVAGAAALGAALAVVARVRKSTLLEVWGGLVLAGGLGVACRMQLLPGDAIGWSRKIGVFVLSNWSLVLIGLSVAWLVGAWAFSAFTRENDRLAVIGAIGAATVSVMVAGLAPGVILGWTCVVWVAVAMALVAANLRLRKYLVDQIGLAVLAAGAALWAYRFVVSVGWFTSTAGAMAHHGLLVAVMIVAAMLSASWWLWRGTPRRATWAEGVMGTLVLAGVLLFAATSLEVSRSASIWVPNDRTAQAAMLSIWWSVFAVGLLVIGFAMRVPIVRHVGLGLLSFAMVKAGIYDVWNQEAVWRVVGFFGVGMLLLGVSVAYAKLSPRLGRVVTVEE